MFSSLIVFAVWSSLDQVEPIPTLDEFFGIDDCKVQTSTIDYTSELKINSSFGLLIYDLNFA